jgi:hypothetical protein
MKYILILLFAVSVSNSNAQYQSIFGSEKTSWHFYEWSIFAYFKDSIVSDERITHPTYGELHVLKYYKIGVLDGTRHIHEDLQSGKISVINISTGNEFEIIDMALNVGDTFSNPSYPNLPSPNSIVDSVYWDDLNRKHIRFNEIMPENYNQKFEFIEGVGNSTNLYKFNWYNFTTRPLLTCHFKNDTLSYSNPSPFVENCVPSFLSVNSLESSSIHIYPNPVLGSFVISDLATGILTNLELFDLQGKTVRVFDPSQQTFSVEEIQSGFYLLKMKTDTEARCVRIEIIN